MPELPRISGSENIKAFKKLGFYKARQKGSHVVMRNDLKALYTFIDALVLKQQVKNTGVYHEA